MALIPSGCCYAIAGVGAQSQATAVPLPRANVPKPGEVWVRAVRQDAEGQVYRLEGAAELETAEFLIRADRIEYNELTGNVLAEGQVRFRSFVSGESLEADRVNYNVREETGTFYGVRGEAPGKVAPRRGVLATANPFVFEGEWAERLKDRYILHEGFLTNCRLPKPIWTLRGPKFDIVPNKRALAYRSQFRVRGIPLLWVPVFHKSLEEQPRRSGFLTPNFGNSSRRGLMLGLGYYWALNRSYDVSYRAQYFSQRGFAHHVNARGRPTQKSEFDLYVYGVNDRGKDLPGGGRIEASGALLSLTGLADLGRGFLSRWDINYLSSFQFRQEFTESFNEAVFAEVHSVGYVTRNWSSYGLNFVFRRSENFQSTEENDKIAIRKLPAVEFSIRDREISRRVLPVWVSLESSVGFLRRNQLLFQTRRFVERADLQPRVATAVRWKDFHIVPAFSLRGTHYGSSWQNGQISGEGVFRGAGEFTLDLNLPPLARIWKGPSWLGDQVKHVVEARAGYRRVTGVDDFQNIILFDETELLSSTSEVDYGITNRLYVKRAGRAPEEFASWELWQARYLDPEFGGALDEGKRNVLLSSARLTGYAFLDGPRRYSPVVSRLTLNPRPGIGIGWRSDWDPHRRRFTHSGLTVDARMGKYFLQLGHNQVRSNPALSPPANQFRGMFVAGDPGKRGWTAAFSAVYDYREGVMQFATTQVSYNTDCCGLSFQFRRLNFGTRDENQFRVAFAIANIGSFGTLRPQDQLF